MLIKGKTKPTNANIPLEIGFKLKLMSELVIRKNFFFFLVVQ